MRAPPAPPRARREAPGGGDGEAEADGLLFKGRCLFTVTNSGVDPQEGTVRVGLNGMSLSLAASGRQVVHAPLDTILRWVLMPTSQFLFWARMNNCKCGEHRMIDPKAEHLRFEITGDEAVVRTVLDTMTSACLQVCEMMGRKTSAFSGPCKEDDTPLPDENEPAPERRSRASSFAEWVATNTAAGTQSRTHWVPDKDAVACSSCESRFSTLRRRHHCRLCGDVFCAACTQSRIVLHVGSSLPVRVCSACRDAAEVSKREAEEKEVKDTVGNTSMLFQFKSHNEFQRELQKMEATSLADQHVSEGPAATPTAAAAPLTGLEELEAMFVSHAPAPTPRPQAQAQEVLVVTSPHHAHTPSPPHAATTYGYATPQHALAPTTPPHDPRYARPQQMVETTARPAQTLPPHLWGSSPQQQQQPATASSQDWWQQQYAQQYQQHQLWWQQQQQQQQQWPTQQPQVAPPPPAPNAYQQPYPSLI